jgi:hypothetical protein
MSYKITEPMYATGAGTILTQKTNKQSKRGGNDMMVHHWLFKAKVRMLLLLMLLGSASAMADEAGMWHTIRAPDGTWLPFGDIRAATGFSSGFVDVAIAGNDASGELQVVGVDGQRKPQHTIRAADGSWLNFGDVTNQAGNPGPIGAIATALIGCDLHVVAQTISDAKLYHTIRYCDGSWQRFGDVIAQAGNPGLVSDVTISGNSDTGELHVVVGTYYAGYWHTIRGADGSWLQFGYVGSPPGYSGGSPVATALIDCNLHFMTQTSSGLWHRIRYCDGNWSPFGNVTLQQFNDVSIAGDSASGQLHVVATDGARVFHTIRNSDGTWLLFGDVTAQAGNPAVCGIWSVGAGLIGGNLDVVITTAICEPPPG